jgi:peptide/nickel transport system permease protein
VWTYLARRLLIMIPTLFGVTLVSFCIMQLAPGDPLMDQQGASGTAGQSTNTREAYLIRKRDLKLDKPLVLNFNRFRDYGLRVRIAAHFMGLTLEQIEREVPALADPRTDEDRARLAFVRRLGIPEFDRRLRDPAQFGRLARAIQVFVQTFCEDTGAYAAPAALEILQLDAPLELRIGAIRALNRMVVEPHQYTFSQRPIAAETPRVIETWRTWYELNESKLPPLTAERRAALDHEFPGLVTETNKSALFKKLRGMRNDLRYFAERLQSDDATLADRATAAMALRLLVGEQPLRMDVPLDATPEQVAEVTRNWEAHFRTRQAEYHPSLARKLWYIVADTQYAHMVWRLVTFNFGRSALKTREPVSEKIWAAVKVSAPLMLLSQVVIYLVAVPLGVICAVRRAKFADRAISLVLFFLYSVPPFVAAMLMLLFLCYGSFLKLFPMQGLHSDGADSYSAGRFALDYAWHIALPVTCLSLFSLAALAMYSRSSMLDVIGQDYIRTARAKGLSSRAVVLKHALRNGMIPILTLFSNLLPAMLGGSVLIEHIFGIPGMGRLSLESIELKDFPTLMALIYIDAIVVMASILLTDILYVVVDPRITFGAQGKGGG